MKQLQLPELETPEIVDGHLPWHARAGILIDDYGFQPTTISEINSAFSGVIAFDDSAGKAGRHLHEVLLHQRANPLVDSPDRAVRAIVREMGYFFSDAKARRDGLRSVYDTLRDGVNPNLYLLEIEGLDSLGVLSGIQHYAVRKGIADKNRRPLKGGVKELNNKHALVTGYDVSADSILNEVMMENLLKTLPAGCRTTGEFATLALDAGISQKKRREWWRDGLVKSRSHLAARPVADRILSSADVVS